MKASDIPAKFPIPFGANATGGTIRTIPTTTTDPNAASLNLGYPQNTMTPIGAGGSPPDGRDMNGILFESTSWDRWFSAGGSTPWDSAFSVAVGGYPQGATVQSAVLGIWWLCLIDDNTTNPDLDGAGWLAYSPLTPAATQFITPIGAWSATIPARTSLARVTIGAGGGGGAGNTASQSGSGGGGGGVGTFFLTGLVPGQALSGVVGAAGVIGSSGGHGGGNGGNTTLLVNGVLQATALGGAGGGFALGAGSPGGFGGAVTLGTFVGTSILLPGSDGGDGSLTLNIGGSGAPGWQGAGAGRMGTGVAGGGEPATSYGAGGGGSYGSTPGPGGIGFQGFVEIEWGRV